VESGLDTMLISIDGATQEVYERFRRNGELELVLYNFRKIVETKKKLRHHNPILVWNYLAFEHNIHEIDSARRLARKLGVNQFRVASPFDVSWDDPDVHPIGIETRVERLDWPSAATSLFADSDFLSQPTDSDAIESAFERPWRVHELGNEALSSGDTCHWLYKDIVMDATGRILPCCGPPGAGRNLVFGRFNEVGNNPIDSEKHRTARSFFRGERSVDAEAPYCVECEWDKSDVNIGAVEIERYFRGADPRFFDRRSLRLLSGW
jgi:MoaA/NifB/PqqE/SkfB family radical SAM enzyme